LDRHPSRWENFTREARRQVVEGGRRLLGSCHRVAAIDGKLLDAGGVNESVDPTYPLDAQYYVDPDPRLLTLIREKAVHVSMSREEIAVALSHIKAWRRMAAENRSYALILEDDVFFEARFSAQLNRTWRELPKKHNKGPEFDLLYLSFREVERGAQRVVCSPNLLRPIRGYWWLSGYVLSNAGARKLLQLLPVTGPVDLWMNHRFANLDVYSTPTSVISQRTDLQSGNRYSILPLLTQIGVQTDRTHLVLEQTRGPRPVFCVGFGREAANILESALSLLGYRCCNDRWGFLSHNVGRLLEENLPLLFDAYIRVRSVSKQIARIQEMYADASFIVPPTAQEDGEVPSEEYSAVRARLRSKEDNLLAFDVRDPSDWRNLCKFLRCKRPSYPFPTNGLPEDVPALLSGSVRHIPLAARRSIVQEHDVHPWIVPYERMLAFGVLRGARAHGTRAGVFKSVAVDDFSSFDESRWTALEDSFPSNLARFRGENIAILSPHGCRLTLNARSVGDRGYSAASVTSKESYRYGRFELIMKPARTLGVVTAFFLHRTDPWQEIDVELLGSDTTKLLVNVYFNPGDAGAKCNFGNKGTPVVIDLTFDAAEAYHRYAIEWEPHEVRWFVDDELIHVRASWEPTPIPNLPMGVYCSIWPPRSGDLAGTLRSCDLPASCDLSRIELWEWCAAFPTSPLKAT
jgi:GR25 family glycosyltransferase involved in LPS biosynthesis